MDLSIVTIRIDNNRKLAVAESGGYVGFRRDKITRRWIMDGTVEHGPEAHAALAVAAEAVKHAAELCIPN